MDKNRRNKKYSNWNNQNKNNQHNNSSDKQKKNEPVRQNYDDAAMKERQQAIQQLKAKQIVCPKCNQVIQDVASALSDKTSGAPIHFECAIGEVEKSEKLGQNEKIAYIGQGRFGVLYFENPRDQRHFTIKKIIEWENRETKSEWRNEYSELYSKVN